mmetsp:Transcript_16253/g.22704  ORF Transcript_16253/g.22704 Transcript_16253/m.22704 type:complete len:166 (-) Transcript_16253:172-669(-)
MSKDKTKIELQLPECAVSWLKKKAQSNSLSDESKALRCCINYAAQEASDEVLFSKGSLADLKDQKNLVEVTYKLAKSQSDWVEKKSTDFNIKASTITMAVLDACMKQTNDSVFKIVRCKTNTTLTPAPRLKEKLCVGGLKAQAEMNAKDVGKDNEHKENCMCQSN